MIYHKELFQAEDEWMKKLTPEQFKVLRRKGTEAPFTGEYYNCKDQGIYVCVSCGNRLFSSNTKFESGTGWPSFYTPFSKKSVNLAQDNSYEMRRIEVLCARCGGHLGHVFDDGPQPTGKRFCINSCTLKLHKK